MITDHEYSPQVKSQFELINRYKGRLEHLSPESKVRIKPIFIKDGDSAVRGFRLILQENQNAKKGLITDWDDTLENYSSRKPRYFESVYANLQELPGLPTKETFFKIFNSINKAARILNWQKIHPEQYSPLLEMVTETQLIQSLVLNSPDTSLQELINDPNENTARNYIRTQIAPLFGNSISTHEKYFVENQHQSLAHTLDQKSDLVSDAIHSSYNQAMTGANLSQEDLSLFDLDESAYWVVSTFGAAEFQLEKIVNSLELMQQSGKRLPNEIMIITQGRKRLALAETIKTNPDLDRIYVDDSERQLEELDTPEFEKLKKIRAKRKGTKRFNEPSIFSATNMDESLSELINK